MKYSVDMNRAEIEEIIDQWIVGNRAERNRQIMKRRLIDGIRFDLLAEEFQLSEKQVKRVVYKGTEQIIKHRKEVG